MQSMQIEEFKWRLNNEGTVFDYIDNLENENKLLKEKYSCHLADYKSADVKGNDCTCELDELLNKE